MPPTKIVSVAVKKSYSRSVALTPINRDCAWCQAERHEERYPGSFLSVLCQACARRYHAWRQENYRRRLAGQTAISLPDWAVLRGHPAVPCGPHGNPSFLGKRARTPGRKAGSHERLS
jgi:hypothetical protein